MDFQPTERQVYWRDRVRDFIEAHVRPEMGTYKAQDAEGDRWKVIPVIEEKKKLAKEAGIWNLFMPPRNDSHHHVDDSFEFDVRASPISNTLYVPRKWGGCLGQARCSIAQLQTLAIWKCFIAMVRANKRNNGFARL